MTISGIKNNYYKKVALTFVISLSSIVGFSQLTVNNAQLCATFSGMPLYAQGDSYIENNTGQTLELTPIQIPTGSSLQQGMNYSMAMTLEFSQEGEYIFAIIDSVGVNYATWYVESFYLPSVSAGSSSVDICANDTVPLVGNLPYDNQGNLYSYFSVDWTQVDTLPAVDWITASDVQIAKVTNFPVLGTYTFEYTINPGTNCSSSDIVTVTVETCDIVTSVSEINAHIHVYPTVVENQLNVLNTYGGDLHLVLFNLNGRQEISEEVSTGDNIISTHNLPEGMYVYRISDSIGQILISGKMIVL